MPRGTNPLQVAGQENRGNKRQRVDPERKGFGRQSTPVEDHSEYQRERTRDKHA